MSNLPFNIMTLQSRLRLRSMRQCLSSKLYIPRYLPPPRSFNSHHPYSPLLFLCDQLPTPKIPLHHRHHNPSNTHNTRNRYARTMCTIYIHSYECSHKTISILLAGGNTSPCIYSQRLLVDEIGPCPECRSVTKVTGEGGEQENSGDDGEM